MTVTDNPTYRQRISTRLGEWNDERFADGVRPDTSLRYLLISTVAYWLTQEKP